MIPTIGIGITLYSWGNQNLIMQAPFKRNSRVMLTLTTRENNPNRKKEDLHIYSKINFSGSLKPCIESRFELSPDFKVTYYNKLSVKPVGSGPIGLGPIGLSAELSGGGYEKTQLDLSAELLLQENHITVDNTRVLDFQYIVANNLTFKKSYGKTSHDMVPGLKTPSSLEKPLVGLGREIYMAVAPNEINYGTNVPSRPLLGTISLIVLPLVGIVLFYLNFFNKKK